MRDVYVHTQSDEWSAPPWICPRTGLAEGRFGVIPVAPPAERTGPSLICHVSDGFVRNCPQASDGPSGGAIKLLAGIKVASLPRGRGRGF